eukprot:s387_g1.t2
MAVREEVCAAPCVESVQGFVQIHWRSLEFFFPKLPHSLRKCIGAPALCHLSLWKALDDDLRMPGRAFGVISTSGRRCVLSALADLAASPLEKRSIDDLIQLGKASHKERALQLHETLKVGLARCAMRLTNMPLGFCHAPSIRRVSLTYVQNFKQVMDFEDKEGLSGLCSEEYNAITNGIFNQHRGTMLDVAKGVFEFNEDLNQLFGPDLELAELRHLQLIQDIEDSLDEFFTNRLTLRLMISHIQALNANKNVNSDGEAMVGVVNVSTHPITILSRAYVATRFMCMRDFQTAPELLVNRTMHDEYVQQGELFSWMGIFNIITNVFFLIDMLMQFFIAKRLIALRYLKGWFAIDLASTVPLDYLSPGSGLGLLRTIRLLRLLKLLRLARGIRVVRRYQAEFGLSYRKMTLYLLFFSVLAVSHWLACTLGIVHKFEIEYEICSRLDLEEGRTDCSTSWLTEGMRYHADWGDSENPTVNIFEAYIMAFYTGERLLFTILLLIGGFMWTQVISRSTAIASSLNAHQLAHQQTMDDLNNIANRLSLSFDMKVRLRKFFLRSQAQHEYQAWQEILSRMSPQLRRDTYREVNVHWVKKVRFFDGCSTSFLVGIAEILEIKMFGEQEHFGQLFHMYIMMGGTASRVINFNLLLPGMIWGEDHLLLSNPDLVCSNIAVSLTVVEVQEVSKEGFDSVLEDFPDHAQILRREVVKFIVIRGVKRLAQLTLEAREKQEGLARLPAANPSSAWNKRLVSGDDTESGSPELIHANTLELDSHAQSIIDGARLINMQYNAAKSRFSKDLGKIPIASGSTSAGSKPRSESRRSLQKRELQVESFGAGVIWSYLESSGVICSHLES